MNQVQKCSKCLKDKSSDFFKIKGKTEVRFKVCIECSSRWNCNQCEYSCSSNGTLKTHIKQVHDKIRDVICNQCEFACSTNSDIKRHIKQVHNKIKDVICNQCEFSCSSNSTLKRHIKQVHDKIRDVICNQCEFSCSTNSDLKMHIKQVHDKIRDIKCNQCEYSCSKNSHLKKHIKICTGKLNISAGEYAVRKVLEFLHIKYKTEICAIPNLRLRFDFELYLKNEIRYIEYDGQQHYKPIQFGGMSEEKSITAFTKVQKHDKIKNDWCKKNNIKLLRISYLNFENISTIINTWIYSDEIPL